MDSEVLKKHLKYFIINGIVLTILLILLAFPPYYYYCYGLNRLEFSFLVFSALGFCLSFPISILSISTDLGIKKLGIKTWSDHYVVIEFTGLYIGIMIIFLISGFIYIWHLPIYLLLINISTIFVLILSGAGSKDSGIKSIILFIVFGLVYIDLIQFIPNYFFYIFFVIPFLSLCLIIGIIGIGFFATYSIIKEKRVSLKIIEIILLIFTLIPLIDFLHIEAYQIIPKVGNDELDFILYVIYLTLVFSFFTAIDLGSPLDIINNHPDIENSIRKQFFILFIVNISIMWAFSYYFTRFFIFNSGNSYLEDLSNVVGLSVFQASDIYVMNDFLNAILDIPYLGYESFFLIIGCIICIIWDHYKNKS